MFDIVDVPAVYGSMVFNETVMKERLPEEVYTAVRQTIEQGTALDKSVAAEVAKAMKDWAISKGATHFTHWFQPLTGVTAEKHDSFLSSCSADAAIMEFSGRDLIKGEPDASSFPSGGLRATFEARGYTAWDPTSYAFIKDNTLYIPSAFCSYGGEALDKKTPLLRSMDAIGAQALRVLRLFGNTDVNRVITNVGAEQEYFLVDKALYEKRKDLIFTGRTLFGAPPPKGQELDDHYFGVIKPRVAAFMAELDEELWKLGIPAKTEHNEAAPSQHEMAPIYTTTNVATDQNQLTMEVMKRLAEKHGLVCLLHEKPFKGVNGSGKHNNWSLATDTGLNLLKPGKTPAENAQFLLFLVAVVKAVDEYAPLLRIAVAGQGNDHRLGGNEAPPAILSVFLGSELTEILDCIVNDIKYENHPKSKMKLGVDSLPTFSKDNTDRNRTSPFAFTGNKFEFRMVGSSASLADANIVINTIVAEELKRFADELEGADSFEEALNALIKRTVTEHKRIIFNGDGYSHDWEKEAQKRGLLNLRSTADCLPYMIKPEFIKVFTDHGVYTESEIRSRYQIELDNYVKLMTIEGRTALDMLRQEILPAALDYESELARVAERKAALRLDVTEGMEHNLITRLSVLMADLYRKADDLEADLKKITEQGDALAKATFLHDTLLADMDEARLLADRLEELTARKYWPFPTYSDLLFSI